MKCLIPILLITLSINVSRAFDLAVQFYIAETGEVYLETTPRACFSDNTFITEPEKMDESGWFLFKKLPNEDIKIFFDLGNNVYTETVTASTDSIRIELPINILPKRLNDVEVEAENRYFTDEKQVYVPTKQQKHASDDGARLLFNMGIPTIKVTLMDNSISTASGEPVATFIDYLPATSDDLKNIRTSEVVRVDVLDHPSDPRFMGALHVVNFIMVKYEYGGYAKFSGNQWLVSTTGNYSAFARTAYKSMTYEARLGASYHRIKHNGLNSRKEYTFPFGTVNLDKETLYYRSSGHGVGSHFKAVYNSKKMVLSNIVGVSYGKIPYSTQVSQEKYSSPEYLSGISDRPYHSRDLTYTWQANYQFFLPNQFNLVVNPSASFGTHSVFSDYMAREEDIVNDTHDEAWEAAGSATLEKKFGQHSVSLRTGGSAQGNKMEYRGFMQDDVNSNIYNFHIQGQGQLKLNKVFLWLSASARYFRYVFNDAATDDWQPHFFGALQYTINRKSRLSFSSEYAMLFNSINEKAPNTVISTQINGKKGNPELSSSRMLSVSPSYTYLFSNKFSVSAFGSFVRWSNDLLPVYESEEIKGRWYMINSLANGGFRNIFNYGINATVNLFNNSLSFGAGCRATSMCQHGVMYYKGTDVNYDVWATYTLKGFYLSGQFVSRHESINQWVHSRFQPTLYLSAGWGNADWNVQFNASNPFSKSYRSYDSWFVSPLYSESSRGYSYNAHYNFGLSVTYSFSYGKKIERGNESSTPEGVGTNILK